MLRNLLFGLPMMVACVFMQALLVIAAVRFYQSRDQQLNSTFLTSAAAITGVMLLLMVGNIVQIALWALLFILLGEFQHFNDAFYHSAVNFVTLGYGDVVMSARHKLLGPLEAINGALMIGVSTATLIVAFQNVMNRTYGADHSRT